MSGPRLRGPLPAPSPGSRRPVAEGLGRLDRLFLIDKARESAELMRTFLDKT